MLTIYNKCGRLYPLSSKALALRFYNGIGGKRKMIGLLTQFMRRLRLKTWRRCRRVFVPVMLLIVCVGGTSCSTLKSINARTDVSCEVFKPITWSDKDSKSTLKEIFIHNKAWDAICQ